MLRVMIDHNKNALSREMQVAPIAASSFGSSSINWRSI